VVPDGAKRSDGSSPSGPLPTPHAFFGPGVRNSGLSLETAGGRFVAMDDRRAALVLAGLALAGAGVRLALTRPPESAAGDVALVSDTPPSLAHGALRETARVAARLARPLLPGERVDLDHADVTEITRLPRVGPALARRIVDWRAAHGPFGSLARFDSVPGVGPTLLAAIRQYVTFSGIPPDVP